LKDSRVLEPVSRRATKVIKKPDPALEEKDRRKSITFDDISVDLPKE